MTLVKLIVRESIEGLTNDIGLRVLDGYYESNIEEFQDEVDERYIIEILFNKYYEEYKKLFNPKFELKYVC